MNLNIAQKTDFNFQDYLNIFIGSLILLFPIFIIIGTATVEISASIIALYGLSIIIQKKKIRFNFIIFLLFFIYFSCNISSIFSDYQSQSFSRSLFLFRYPLFFYGVYYFLTKNYKYVIYNLITCIFAVIFVYFDDLIQFIFGQDIFGYQKKEHRLSGPFDDELIPGIFLFRFGLLSISALIIIRKIKSNIVINSLLFFLVFGVVITGEKVSSVLTIVSISLFLLINYGLKKLAVIFFIILTMFSTFTVLVFSSETYKDRIWTETTRTLGIFNENRNFFDSEHGVMFLTAFSIWKDYKYFGSGLKTFREVCKDDKYSNFESLVITERCSTHPHNFYLEILSETGIIGFVLFLTLFMYLVINIFKNYKKNNNVITLSIFCTIIIMFIPLSFTNSFFTNFNLFWIVYIISLGFVEIKNA